MIEFAVGDIVHFHAYIERKPISARVLAVVPLSMFHPSRMGEVAYELDGISAPLRTRTSAKSIVESKEYEPISADDAFKD